MFQALQNWRSYRAFKRLPIEAKRIVIYSESGQDWHHFEPVITFLTNELHEDVVYVSSDPHDPGLATNNARLSCFCIGSGLLRTIFFQWLEAGVLVMTMIDFGKLQLKRSVNPVTYAFMFRASNENEIQSLSRMMTSKNTPVELPVYMVSKIL